MPTSHSRHWFNWCVLQLRLWVYRSLPGDRQQSLGDGDLEGQTNWPVCAHKVEFDLGAWNEKSALNHHSTAGPLYHRQPDHVKPDSQQIPVTQSQSYLVPKSL